MDISSLINFLSSGKANVENSIKSNLGDIQVVLGNEAADLDSCVSAIVTAYYLASAISKEEKENKTEEQLTYVFPVVNCTREDFPLRTEVNFFLKTNGIRVENLICRDEIDLADLQSAGRLKLTLVDHNVLALADSYLQPSVVRVIDHHKRDKPLDRKDRIENVGSCCTLVAEMVLPLFDSDPLVCKLLLGTIVYDTVNLSATAQIATQKDQKLVGELEDCLMKCTGKKSPREEFFTSVLRARTDISALTVDQLLRKDCKLLKTPQISVAIPAVPCLSSKFLQLPNAIDALKNSLRINRCTAILLMGWEVPEDSSLPMRRDLTIFSDSIHKAKQVSTPMENCENLQLQLVNQIVEPQAYLWTYEQRNVTLSRKFILPFLVTHFETRAQNRLLDVGDPSGLACVDVLMGNSNGDSSSSPNKNLVNNGSNTNVPSISYLGVGDPISQSGSSQGSAYNSCPYTPVNSYNSCSEPETGGIPIQENYFLPSFNSREMIEKIELKRGKLRGYERSETDELKPMYSSYPFTPKNSFVETSLENYYMSDRAGGAHGVSSGIDQEVLLRKLLEKRRNDSYTSTNSNSSSKSQSLTKLNIVNEAEGGDMAFTFSPGTVTGGTLSPKSGGILSPGLRSSGLNPNAPLFTPRSVSGQLPINIPTSAAGNTTTQQQFQQQDFEDN